MIEVLLEGGAFKDISLPIMFNPIRLNIRAIPFLLIISSVVRAQTVPPAPTQRADRFGVYFWEANWSPAQGEGLLAPRLRVDYLSYSSWTSSVGIERKDLRSKIQDAVKTILSKANFRYLDDDVHYSNANIIIGELDLTRWK